MSDMFLCISGFLISVLFMQTIIAASGITYIVISYGFKSDGALHEKQTQDLSGVERLGLGREY